MRGGRPTPLLAMLLVLAGCSGLDYRQVLENPSPLPPRVRVEGVPFFPQREDYCGPASLAMVLAWSDRQVSRDVLASQLLTPDREGTLRSDLVGGARRQGRLAVPVRGLRALLGELAEGHPVVVLQNLGLSWLPRWHYAVAVGYDLPRGDILLHTGRRRSRRVALATFERTWDRADRWGIVVLPPGKLPATAGPVAVLRAGVGLEKARQAKAAAATYAAVTRRWPGRLGGWIGLGNTRHRLGHLAGAEAAFRAAVRHRPRSGVAWNNLAVVLAARGRDGEAMQAAIRAVRLGGKEHPEYRATLREIRGKESGRSR